MATVSESLDKLSASMAELSQRAKEAEDFIAGARKETHQQLALASPRPRPPPSGDARRWRRVAPR